MSTIVGHIDNGFIDRMAGYKPYTVKVWLALANRAKPSGQCWPSISTIEADTGLRRGTVYRGLNELVASGEITITPGGPKGRQSNVYQFASSIPRVLVPTGNQYPTVAQVVSHGGASSTPRVPEPDEGTRRRNQTKARSRFNPPSVAEVAAYCGERGNHIDPEYFVAYYTANGWKVGRNSMKDWMAAVRTWERNGVNHAQSNNVDGSGRCRGTRDYGAIAARNTVHAGGAALAPAVAGNTQDLADGAE